MNIIKIFSLVSVFVWLVPLVKQFKTKYFLFFLVQALAVPVFFLKIFIAGFNTSNLLPAYIFLLIAALSEKNRRIVWVAASVTTFCLVTYFQILTRMIFGVSALFYLLAVIAVIHNMVFTLVRKREVNLFELLLYCYVCIEFAKYVFIAVNIGKGIINFYAETIVQILFCLLFCLININSKTFKVPFDALEEI